MFLFNEIIGHSSTKDKLIQLCSSNKVPHTSLFSGKMGYSAFLIAMSYIKYQYCTNRTSEDSCNKCQNCIKINKYEHPDIHFLFPSFSKDKLSRDLISNFRNLTDEYKGLFDIKDWLDFNNAKNAKIRESEIESILHYANISPYFGGNTTIVIWGFEQLDKEQNKLLKILEEPPNKSRFILISENINRILPTVISRSSIVKIPKYNNNEITEYLNSHDIDVNNKGQLDICQGNLISARRYLIEKENEIQLEDMLLEYLRGLINFNQRKIKNINLVLNVTDKLLDLSKSECKKFFEYNLLFLQQLIYYQHIGEYNFSIKLEKALYHFAENLMLDQISLWITFVENTIINLDRNIDKRICFVSLAIKVGKIQDRVELEHLENII